MINKRIGSWALCLMVLVGCMVTFGVLGQKVFAADSVAEVWVDGEKTDSCISFKLAVTQANSKEQHDVTIVLK